MLPACNQYHRLHLEAAARHNRGDHVGVDRSAHEFDRLDDALQSIIPDEWKNGIITPVFKKGLAGSVSNYRPISLTCVSSKLME